MLQHRRLALAQRQALVVDHDQRAVALDHRPLRGEVQRRHRDVLAEDVEPDVELGPVRDREHAHRFALVDARVVEVPQFRALVLRVPAVLRVAEREDALLGARLLLVAARAADRGVEAATVQRLLQAWVFITSVCTVAPWVIGPMPWATPSGLVCTRSSTPVSRARAVAERDHLAELPAGVDVQQRDRRARRVEGLDQQVQQHRAVLADRIQHHRVAELGRDLAQDVDAFGLEAVEVGERLQVWHRSWRWNWPGILARHARAAACTLPISQMPTAQALARVAMAGAGKIGGFPPSGIGASRAALQGHPFDEDPRRLQARGGLQRPHPGQAGRFRRGHRRRQAVAPTRSTKSRWKKRCACATRASPPK